MKSHWQDYRRAWSKVTSPLRPPPAAVSAFRRQLAGYGGRTLLLGVTSELADIAPRLVAVDCSFGMVAAVWPGDTAQRKALVGDWRSLPFPPATFDGCVGDGSLTCLDFPGEVESVARGLRRVLAPGGRFVCRLFVSPKPPETVEALRDAAMAGTAGGFHAWKFRLAMALAAKLPRPNVPVASVFEAFAVMFPDREALTRATGWQRESVDTIDFYRGSSAVFSLPDSDQILGVISAIFPDARLVPSGDYEFAERCPLLVATAP